MNRPDAIRHITEELDKAYEKHNRIPWSRHEFYGIMLEEVEEAFDDIKRNVPLSVLRKEVAQIACVCLRFLEQAE